MKQPQTAAEHEDDIDSSSSDSDDDSSSSSGDSTDYEYEQPHQPQNRRISTDSVHSNNFPYIFPSRRKRRQDIVNDKSDLRNRGLLFSTLFCYPLVSLVSLSFFAPGFSTLSSSI